MGLASFPPAPVWLARGNRDEQHINAIPKRSSGSTKNAKSHRPAPICPQFPGSVNRSWSIAEGDYRTLLFRCHRQRGPIASLSRFLSRARSLLTRKFRVAISGTIGFWPIDCAFRDQEIEQTSGSPLVAWHAKSVATSFLRLDQETGDAKRHRQVVQPDQGLWVHQADGRR